MTKITEGWHTVEDGTKLYTCTWSPEEPPKAILAFVHGFSDHCNAYYNLFPTLASRGIEVHSFDQRGWGRSVHLPPDRGLTGPTSLVLADITSFLTALPATAPLFLMGHSMGGAEILHYALLSPSSPNTPPVRAEIRGFLAEAPFIALHPSAEPSWFVVFAGRIAGKLFPKRQMLQKLESKWLCRDEQVCKDWEADELCHDTGTLEGMAGMLDRGAQLDAMRMPIIEGAALWVGHGSEDRVTSCEASKRFMAKVGTGSGKEMKVYDGWYHKLHAEPGEDAKTFANDVGDWILARCGEQEGMGKSKL